jgi:hypothetical protein
VPKNPLSARSKNKLSEQRDDFRRGVGKLDRMPEKFEPGGGSLVDFLRVIPRRGSVVSLISLSVSLVESNIYGR